MIRTLLIDNYDSFTFNLFQLIAEVNGCEPIVVRNDEATWDELRQRRFDNIVISPGPGSPARPEDFGVCADVVMNARCPVLGVCLGHQGIAHYSGARVEHAPQPMHGRISEVLHDGSELFAGVPNPFRVVRYHSLAVTSLPNELTKTAWTWDGLVMALRHANRPLFGVQFHPESICTEAGGRIIQNFLKIAEPSRAPAPPPRIKKLSAGAARGSAAALQAPTRKLSFWCDPETAFIELFAQSENAFWLDSATDDAVQSRFSYMGRGNRILRYFASRNELVVAADGVEQIVHGDLLDYLDKELRQQRIAPQTPFEFASGLVGYLGYESTNARGGDPAVPDAMFLRPDQMIVFDHDERSVWLLGDQPWMERAQQALKSSSGKHLDMPRVTPQPINLRLRRSPADYLRMIDRCMEYLHDGESYELCLTNQLFADADIDPLSYYRNLRRINPAPFAAFLRFADLAIACSSPECFLNLDAGGMIESKPIKGTAPRDPDPLRDRQSKDALASDEKTRAENLMIVDLLRNDLGRVCEIGSVRVPALMQIESYATVHQMVSTIQGKLKADCTALDCIRAAFPGGSMTGAPKIRSIKLLEELEKGPRGIYSGAIGFLSDAGTMKLNIVIRTAVLHGNKFSAGSGGAIVALSNPQAELQETFLKWQPLIEALAQATGNATNDLLKPLQPT